MKELIALLIITGNLYGQTFSFQAGVRPNNLKGSFLTAELEVVKLKRINFSVLYNFLKYTDSFANINPSQPTFHLENTRDRLFIEVPSLHRGIPIQFNEIDLKPRDLIHRIGLYAGYDVVNNRNFYLKVGCGLHYSQVRKILWYYSYEFATVEISQGDDPIVVPYNDYQVYNRWDIGGGILLRGEYKIFKNVSIGINSSIFFDVIAGGIDLVNGIGITYHFNL